ncbi:hypothetical protein AB0L00_04965 [Actinoallomurus sp. NPDC052308]|uniref:hypothetical protein n=1 Tax=Actinoallomurus sp. NPDC052308 TaxID=3155530 RepID=UPI0034233B6C
MSRAFTETDRLNPQPEFSVAAEPGFVRESWQLCGSLSTAQIRHGSMLASFGTTRYGTLAPSAVHMQAGATLVGSYAARAARQHALGGEGVRYPFACEVDLLRPLPELAER